MVENGASTSPLRRSFWPITLVCSLYLVGCALAHVAGFRMEVGWNRYQLLDRAVQGPPPEA